MFNTKRKIYSTEFKESSVKLAVESKHPIAHTAKVMCQQFSGQCTKQHFA